MTLAYHEMDGGVRLAFLNEGLNGTAKEARTGACGTFWLGGFMSDMTGSKAEALAEFGQQAARPAFRFDYSGHGASGGEFRQGTISRWLGEAESLFLHCAPGNRILVGSSMGGWLALLLARQLQHKDPENARRIKGMVLIAPAADMTRDLMWSRYDEATRREITENGFFAEASQYGPDPYIITRDLIEDGENHLVLENPIEVDFPVHILHGDQDPDVPWSHGLKIYRALSGPDVTFSLIKGGDHRLSNPGDLALLKTVCGRLCAQGDVTSS